MALVGHGSIVIILKMEKKHTAVILYVIAKFQIFYLLSCKGVASRERENEGLCSVAKKIVIIIIDFIFLQCI